MILLPPKLYSFLIPSSCRGGCCGSGSPGSGGVGASCTDVCSVYTNCVFEVEFSGVANDTCGGAANCAYFNSTTFQCCYCHVPTQGDCVCDYSSVYSASVCGTSCSWSKVVTPGGLVCGGSLRFFEVSVVLDAVIGGGSLTVYVKQGTSGTPGTLTAQFRQTGLGTGLDCRTLTGITPTLISSLDPADCDFSSATCLVNAA